MCTANSLTAPYCKKELGYAKSNGKSIIAVLVDGVLPKKGWFALEFQDVNCVNILVIEQKNKFHQELIARFTPNTIVEKEKKTEVTSLDSRELIQSNSDKELYEVHIGTKGFAESRLEQIELVDKTTPLVVLFGPSGCGKTMTLIRLARFLGEQGYTIEPNRYFRPREDYHYKIICDSFQQLLNSGNVPFSTALNGFLLVDICLNGRPVLQILDCPGEFYFIKDKAINNRDFHPILTKILSTSKPKLWALFLEPQWSTPICRMEYTRSIHRLIPYLRPEEKILFVYNKIDKTQFVLSPGKVNKEGLIRDIQNYYPGLLDSFRVYSVFPMRKCKYRCEFVPFQTGFYSQYDGTSNIGRVVYTPSAPEFPRQLWVKLSKLSKSYQAHNDNFLSSSKHIIIFVILIILCVIALVYYIWDIKHSSYLIEDDRGKEEIVNLAVRDTVEISFRTESGVKYIPVKINNGPIFDMVFDTGCSNTLISAKEAQYLLQEGSLTVEDVQGMEVSQIADGKIVKNTIVNINSSLKI